ncbi:MAG TPA: ATP-binding cassette domain-containing protein, partial [Dactylosporangium sp.]|nr:ATP-binding cassette domain-containing protein [Dactylosporangium sp.]
MIEARALTKRFRRNTAVDGVDLDVPAGTVCGLLGPNGAGKTTVVRILATLLRPDVGSARVAGHDVVHDARRARLRLGLAGQYAAVDEILPGRANLIMFGRLYHLPPRRARERADELLERFRLTDAASRPVRTYSGGMRRRLDLAASLIAAPSVLFLDEPTTGIDPGARLEIWDMIGELVREGTTVLLTTQYLDEADRLADQIVVLDHGRVAAAGTPLALKKSLGGARVDVVLHDRTRAAEAAAIMAGSATVDGSAIVDGSVTVDGSVNVDGS